MNKIKDYITQFEAAIKKMIRDFVDQYAMARGLEISWGVSEGFLQNKKIYYMVYDSLLIKLFVIEMKNSFDHMLRTRISLINGMTSSFACT